MDLAYINRAREALEATPPRPTEAFTALLEHMVTYLGGGLPVSVSATFGKAAKSTPEPRDYRSAAEWRAIIADLMNRLGWDRIIPSVAVHLVEQEAKAGRLEFLPGDRNPQSVPGSRCYQRFRHQIGNALGKDPGGPHGRFEAIEGTGQYRLITAQEESAS